MKKLSKKGFTLIELLVVITIIGILATGVTTIYTSSQQKARDSVRVSDVAAIRTSVEQVYSDDSKYPDPADVVGSIVPDYMPSVPEDPQYSGSTKFMYVYNNGMDSNSVAGQVWEVSNSFENQGNLDSKAKLDDGEDPLRLETGVGTKYETVDGKDTGVQTTVSDAGEITGDGKDLSASTDTTGDTTGDTTP